MRLSVTFVALSAIAALELVASAFPACASAAEPSDGPAIPIPKVERRTPVDFESEILPMLRDNCLACHNRTRAKADLIIETPADILKGGENGPVVVPGDARRSSLLQVAAHQAKPAMPPKDNKVSAADLTGAQLGLLSLWIDQGAKGEVRAAASRAITWQAPPAAVQPVYAVALSPDGRLAAAGCANHVDLYDLPSRRQIATLADQTLKTTGLYGPDGAAHRDMVESLAFSPDGNRLASGGFGEVKLWRRAAPAARFALKVPPNTVAAASPDGRSIAVAAEGSPIRLIDAVTGKELRTLSASTSAPRAIAFSPDGKRLAIISADRGLRISAVDDGALLTQTVLPCDTAAAAWAGAQLVTGGADGIVRLLQVPDLPATAWTALKELKGHTGAVTALAAIPGGTQLLSGGADGSVRLWNLTDAKVLRQILQGSPVTHLAVRPDGKCFASAGQPNAAHLWDASKGEALAELKGSAHANRDVAARERAQQLAAGDVAYFKSAVQKAEASQKAASDRQKAAAEALAAAEKLVAEKEATRAKALDAKAAADAALSTAQAELQRVMTAARVADEAVAAAQESLADAKADLDRSPDDVKALADEVAAQAKAAADATATVAKLAGDAKPKQAADAASKALEQADAETKAAALSRTNAATESTLAATAAAHAADELATAQRSLAAAAESTQKADAALADARRAAAVAAERPVRAISFSPDGATLVTVSDGPLVNVWSGDGAALLDSIHIDGVTSLASVSFCGDDALLVAGPDQTSVWSLGGSWSLEQTIGSGDAASPLVDRVGAVAFSPDGRLLATGSGEPSRTGQLKLWDVATGRPVREFADAHSDAVLALEFSPDGKYLASGAADRLAKIFDVATGKAVRSLEGHTDHVLGVSWRADGRVLATCGADDQVKFWDVASGDRKANAGGFAKAVAAVHYLGVTDQVLAVAADGQVRVLNDAGGAVRVITGAPADFFQAADVTPDGHWFAVGGQAGQLSAWRDSPPAPPAVMTFSAPSRAAAQR